jgi:hypothetical protein
MTSVHAAGLPMTLVPDTTPGCVIFDLPHQMYDLVNAGSVTVWVRLSPVSITTPAVNANDAQTDPVTAKVYEVGLSPGASMPIMEPVTSKQVSGSAGGPAAESPGAIALKVLVNTLGPGDTQLNGLLYLFPQHRVAY